MKEVFSFQIIIKLIYLLLLLIKYPVLKVVHIIEALGGGVYTYFRDLSTFFGDDEIRKNTQTTIIYSSNRKEIDPEKIESEFSNGVNLIHINMVREFSPIQDLKSVYKLRKDLKRINPDVIHLHSSKAGVLGRFAYFFLFQKKKLFYSPHGYSFLRTDISKSTRNIYWKIEKAFQFLANSTIIACGDSEYEISKNIGTSKLVRNGIDLTTFNKQFDPQENKKLTIGVMGRITFQKNPQFLNQIALNFPDLNFVWIGDGDLRPLITSPNIRITGWILDRKTVLTELNNIDIYMQISLWEGLPIAVLEAMALQKPVIATNIIGNKDAVLHNKTGFLFDDISELSQYFDILKDPATRTTFGRNAFVRCNDLFDKDKNFKELLAIYNQ